MFGSVASDDELAQTWDPNATAEGVALGVTLEKADRILAAARELDQRMVAEAFADAQIGRFGDPSFASKVQSVERQHGSTGSSPGVFCLAEQKKGLLPDQEQEIQRLQRELAEARKGLEDEKVFRLAAERELASAYLSIQSEKEKARVLANELQEERQKVRTELARNESLQKRCEELEELAAAATTSVDASAGSGCSGGTGDKAMDAAPHCEAEGRAPNEDHLQLQLKEDLKSKVGQMLERLDGTLAELEKQGNLLSSTIAAKDDDEDHDLASS
eukprot:TRINITY_DN5300_c1_g3_i1.p1 TRINITY_DN5300_c1_g3~~TRINITY_DN5300_c1_g3_i1.p1  ORF type:complete len:274 (-),score=83.85 TRINITY_DN5300_c1_g3_i1:74-895(-)